MKFRRTRYGYVVRIDTGEEIIATLRDFARAEGVRSGQISGLGAVGETELGFFVRATGQYVATTGPIRLRRGTVPQSRESQEATRLSPMTK